tara:strand:+ start:702 stop:1868 length:1167 start_codon:yes stop_codon:yes gene_type:complete
MLVSLFTANILGLVPKMTASTLRAQIAATKKAAGAATPFDDAELDRSIRSLQAAASGAPQQLDSAAYRKLLSKSAHMPHKDWARTESAADELASLIASPDDETFGHTFQRVLEDGGWVGASRAAAERAESTKPWVVLVTGVNGIRKTSTIYQPWFRDALGQALAGSGICPTDELPDGNNSYFRQLDYMIATVASEEFKELYELEDIEEYASKKDSIFSRYRTLAEMLGVLLVKASKAKRMNLLVETSGRDIAMFKYIDFFFPDDAYRKLVVHFTINDIGFAERSVDRRMQGEMQKGRAALAGGNVREIIQANAGGPYGSAVLRGVQADSDAVWESVRSGEAEGGAALDWCKARIAISAHETEPWSACAVPPPGAADTAVDSFVFGPPR